MNVRLSYADINNNGSIEPASEILEENNYYPFGLKHQGYNDIANSCKSEQAEKYQYNGKEFEDSFGLNIYEMDLRQYDPAIGRWTVQDPVIHHEFSPYSAFDNNPAYWADPSGANSIQYDWRTGMYNVLGNNGDVLKVIESGSFNLSEYLNNPDKYINHILYSMDANFDESGNDDGGGKGNGGGNGTKLHGGPFDGQNSGNIAIYNDFFVFYLDKRHVTQLSHMEAFELFENFFKSRQQMFEKVMFWGDKSGYLPMANFKSLMRELGKANPTRLSAQALLEYANWKTSDVSSQNESIFRSYLGLHVDNPADMKGVIQIYERTEVLIYQSITVHYYDVATGSYLGKVN